MFSYATRRKPALPICTVLGSAEHCAIAAIASVFSRGADASCISYGGPIALMAPLSLSYAYDKTPKASDHPQSASLCTSDLSYAYGR